MLPNYIHRLGDSLSSAVNIVILLAYLYFTTENYNPTENLQDVFLTHYKIFEIILVILFWAYCWQHAGSKIW